MTSFRSQTVAAMVFFFCFAVMPPVDTALSGTAEYAYRRAQSQLERLLNAPEEKKYRHNWLECINRFKGVYRLQPDGPWADDALFMIAELYARLFRYSFNERDRTESEDYYRRLLKRFPRTPYRRDTRQALGQGRPKQGEPVPVTSKPVAVKRGVVKKRLKGTKKTPPKAEADETTATHTKIEGLRFWSSADYTRVVIDLKDEVDYSYHLLKKDPSIGKPPRLYIDLKKTRMGKGVRRTVPIGDDLLSDARAGQYSKDTVRVVVDIKSIGSYKIFSLKNPFRVVLDVHGGENRRSGVLADTGGRTADDAGGVSSGAADSRPSAGVSSGPIPKGALARQLALGVQRIVIDPGHGGKDPGAIGYDRRILEKNVTLEVALRLEKKIRERLGLETVLTRRTDVFLSLEERTAIANTRNGDLFVSIHANANRSRTTRGIETYFLNLATDEEAIRVAARENATSTKNIRDLEGILNDLIQYAKIDESSRLAEHVQAAMTRELEKRYGDIRDHGVKQAPFYVLLGAKMPSILVEISFISNPVECRRLNTAAYQEALADALVKGIEKYIRQISPVPLPPVSDQIQAARG